MTMYLFFNLMRYRLLIAKASSFDVMKKRRRAIKIVNFVAHMGIFGFALALNVILLTSTFRIGDHKGVQVCFAANPFVPLGIASSLVAAGDTTISMICLVLNIFPVLGVWKMSAHERKIGILRNAFWAFIPMGSTFAFLVTVTVADFTYGFIVGFVVDVGQLDLLINFLAMALCWLAGGILWKSDSIYILLPPPTENVRTQYFQNISTLDCPKAEQERISNT
mmetsp:Transcript_9525/g.13178  ORF Transcript_9525/g.13178 Transcript_9525/m.13178 type:complete len:222 (-) Transcript_9525:582-1247(-)